MSGTTLDKMFKLCHATFMELDNQIEVDAIRSASRTIVRELGFLEKTLAGTNLPPSSVHTIIEIGQGTAKTATDLTKLLMLEKSSVSRMLKNLIEKELLLASPSRIDARQQVLSLTAKGMELFESVSLFGRSQVRSALNELGKQEQQIVREGLEHYASALQSKKASDQAGKTSSVNVSLGYMPSVLGLVTALHANYYSKNYGFGAVFERKVATEMSEFLSRIDHPDNAIWTASVADHFVGALSIDGQDLSAGIAHLRWFIVDERAQGLGAGKALVSAAMKFVDERKFEETHLWTFSGLDAARHLYEQQGFILANEEAGTQWGTEVLEQKFVRYRQAGVSATF